MIVDPNKLEAVQRTALAVRLADGSVDYLTQVARLGNVGGWMVVEFVDGRQKLYSPYNVVSIEELSERLGLKQKEKAAM